jgi:hypothetical protein
VKESGFTNPSVFVTFPASKPTRLGPARIAQPQQPEVQMKARQTRPLPQLSSEPSLTEILLQTLNGLMPVTPDLSAFFDRMEMPR